MQPVLRSRRQSTIAPTSGARPTSALVDRAARRRGAIVRRATRSGLSLLSLSLSDLGSLFSLSLFPEVIWSENEGRNWFPGQRWKYWSIGSHFPENDIFRDSQTSEKWWKWFPEIIFTQNKRTLNVFGITDVLDTIPTRVGHVWNFLCVCVFFFIGFPWLLGGCLVNDFKQPFSVFKQHFTHFNVLFHPHVFPQMFLNNNFQFLNICTKRTLEHSH